MPTPVDEPLKQLIFDLAHLIHLRDQSVSGAVETSSVGFQDTNHVEDTAITLFSVRHVHL